MSGRYCDTCHSGLTVLERHYYGRHCERCIQLEHVRLEAWRKGGPDRELDALYGSPAPSHSGTGGNRDE